MIEVTQFKGTGSVPIKNISIDEALSRIKNGDSKKYIDAIRKESSKEKRSQLKAQLPSITFAGVFSHREIKSLVKASELLILDFDHISDPVGFKNYVFHSEFVFASWISPSGDGVKVLIRIPVVDNDKTYKEYYNAALQLFDIEADEKTKDISRLTFESYDEAMLTRDWEKVSVFEDRIKDNSIKTRAVNNTLPDDITKIFKNILTGLAKNGEVYTIGNRNEYIFKLAKNCNEFGIIEDDAINLILYKFNDLNDAETTNTISGAYKRYADDFNTKSFKLPIVRVGNDYFKIITLPTLKGTYYEKMIHLKSQTLTDDYGRNIKNKIPKYDTFCNIPDNKNEKEIPSNLFNLYKPFKHKPSPGSLKWTNILLDHIFGDQIELGLDYIQLLYENPSQLMPILCLVSKENSTGKTTFVNWLCEIFNGNSIVIGNQELQSGFNVNWGTKLLIAVDESKIDKDHTLEKLKSMATQSKININGKFQDEYTIDFFGKIILLSNYEDNFVNAGDDDIRYWIRKISMPKFENYNIEFDLINEIPAFIDLLINRKLTTSKQSRMWFNPELIATDALENVRKHSKSWMYKEIYEYMNDFFSNGYHLDSVFARPIDIKNKFFAKNSRADISYIRRTLKNEFKFSPELPSTYNADTTLISEKINGTPFKLTREYFTEYIDSELVEPKIPF